MDTVLVRWAAGRQFVGWDAEGHTVVMDAKAAHGGESAGMRPLQVFLCGLAGCTGMDVVSILEKKRQDVRGLEIVVEGTQREDEHPKIYVDIHLHYRVTGYGVSAAAVERAIELSEEKYCSVGGMLGPQVAVRTSYEVLEADAPGSPLIDRRGRDA
ncbi:MAG: OsmC family protein [Coriobacteriia bacterium]|nr:OsmC family protein [Coriobacteriia bacterium]